MPGFKFYLYSGSLITFAGKVSCRRNFFVMNKGEIIIGKNIFFNNDCSINCLEKIIIGNDCLFGENVKIYDHDHVFDSLKLIRNLEYKVSPVKIGNNCWIGSNVVILKGTEIGDNVVIGAGTVVKGKIKSNTIYYNENKKINLKMV